MAETRLIRTEIIHGEGKRRDIFEARHEDGSITIYDEISDYVPPSEPDDKVKREIAELKGMVSQLLATLSSMNTTIENIRSLPVDAGDVKGE